MIGIQGETALDEVTKSPADAALSTTSTNSVQNKVITKKINEINNDLASKNVGSDSETITVSSSTTFENALNQLFNSIDKSKVSVNCRLALGELIYHAVILTNTQLEFVCTFGDTGGLSTNMLNCKTTASSAYRQQADGTGFSFSEYTVGNSNTLIFYY